MSHFEATPRPWRGRDDLYPRPWKVSRRLFQGGLYGFELPNGVTTADARYLVKAVNAYDRLRAIEAAAREVSRFLPGGPNAAMPAGPFINAAAALRAALDERA